MPASSTSATPARRRKRIEVCRASEGRSVPLLAICAKFITAIAYPSAPGLSHAAEPSYEAPALLRAERGSSTRRLASIPRHTFWTWREETLEGSSARLWAGTYRSLPVDQPASTPRVPVFSTASARFKCPQWRPPHRRTETQAPSSMRLPKRRSSSAALRKRPSTRRRGLRIPTGELPGVRRRARRTDAVHHVDVLSGRRPCSPGQTAARCGSRFAGTTACLSPRWRISRGSGAGSACSVHRRRFGIQFHAGAALHGWTEDIDAAVQ